MVLKQKFTMGGKEFVVPTVEAYSFNKQELEDFIVSSSLKPKIIDTHLDRPCSASCLYCFTRRGMEDRYEVSHSIRKLRDSEIEEIANQFAVVGGKTIFICSEGEPLFDPERFLKVASTAVARGLNVLTYTNLIHLNKNIAEKLFDLGVNLVVKLEGLSPKINDKLIQPKGQYSYSKYSGAIIPKQLQDVLSAYSSKLDRVAISSTLTAVNHTEIQEIRNWANDLGCAHFLKRMWVFGDAERNKNILTNFDEQATLAKIYESDANKGFYYPSDLSDTYTLDIRRLLNNLVSSKGYPIRIFSHPRGGVYHSSGIVNPKFGFQEGIVISLIDSRGKINLPEYFEKIQSRIDSVAAK